MSKIIYAFTYPEYEGLLKVGETCRSVEERLKSNILMPSECSVVLEVECDVRDKDVHKALESAGIRRVNGEWFECTKEDVICAILKAKGINFLNEGVSCGELGELVRVSKEIGKIEQKMREMGCEKLSDLCRVIVKVEDCLKSSEKIKKLWEELGVNDINHLHELKKETERIREGQYEEYMDSLIEDIDEERARLFEDDVFTFGRHYGRRIIDVIRTDKEYIDWLTKLQIDLLRKFAVLSKRIEKEEKQRAENIVIYDVQPINGRIQTDDNLEAVIF